MSQIKNAQIRYRIIDRCIRDKYKPFPSKEVLRQACEESLFGSDNGGYICDSTIEKDLFTMRLEHDAPIKYSKKNLGYYYTDESFSINDIPLTEVDLEAIKFAANTLAQFKEIDMFKQFGFAIDKIVDRINISSNPQEKDITELVLFENAISVKGNEHLAPLLQAIRQKKIVVFDYESFQTGKKKARRVVPLLLKEYRNRWYVITFDCIKDELTTYALERIDNLEETPEVFYQKIDFSAEKFFKNAIGITVNNSNPSSIIFKAANIAAKYLASQPLHHSQRVIKKGKNKTIFSLEVIISEELIRTFLSYGGEIEITEPESLRSTIVKRLKEMYENYTV